MTDNLHQDGRTAKPSKKPERPSTVPPGLLERRYSSEWNRPDWLALGPLFAGGLCLGAATFSHFLAKSPTEQETLLLLAFLAGASFFTYRLYASKRAVLVGDAGVGVEQGGELSRLLWWEINHIRYEADALVLSGANTTLRLPSRFHTRAIHAILKEAAERLPSILDVKSKLVDELPKLETVQEPTPEPVHSLQLAGKRCVASKQVISVERDARVCPNCTSVYHRNNLPKVCLTCRCELASRAVAP